ncbi:MarR family winged helix-turn-helix transcriptional regulator [Sphingobium sp. AP50]|uniref:MarR family winged helix-turn-helix transcriptional regulator n=1 Tax=Sphingobium sp. AP50 TaxID=1884369 RepID=UPI001160D1DE|nr:MarR family transcriptional regulator [Sphingobium sp. AP50]
MAAEQVDQESYLPESLGLMARDLYRALTQAIDARVARYGLAAHTCRYLALIHDFNGMTPKDLSTYLGVRSPTTLSALRTLEDKRLITRTRDADDGRKSRYKLTARGAEVEALVRESAVEVEMIAIRQLSPQQLKQFRSVIDLIRESLGDLSSSARISNFDQDAGDGASDPKGNNRERRSKHSVGMQNKPAES